MKNPTGTIRFAISATQNHPFPRPGIAPTEKSGKTSPGPILSGAVARARMVAREPRTWAAIRVKRTWKRVRVWRRIIPKPACGLFVSHSGRTDKGGGTDREGVGGREELTDTLQSVQTPQPQPEAPPGDCAGYGAPGPRNVLSDITGAP